MGRHYESTTVRATERGSGNEMAEVLSYSTMSTTTVATIKYVICGDSEFSLDDIRIASSDLSSTVTYAYNDANELTSMTEGKTGITGCTSTFEYDDWGRTTKMTKAAIGDYTLYQYRYGDKLKRVSKYENSVLKDMSYMYDGLGKLRIEHDVTDDEYTWLRWDLGWQPLGYYAEGSDAGTIWDIGDRTVSLVPDPLGHGAISSLAAIIGSDPSTGTYAGMFKDHLGSTRRLRASDKSALGSYEFTPYGQDYFDHGADFPFKFTGKPYQEDIGMYYFPYRFYSPTSARWLTRDPLGMVDGPNVYAYVAGNPPNSLDPLGQAIITSVITKLIGFVLRICEEHASPCVGLACGAISNCASGFIHLVGAVPEGAVCMLGCPATGPLAPLCIAGCIGGMVADAGLGYYAFKDCYRKIKDYENCCKEDG